MSGPGFTWPDLCSIRAAAEQTRSAVAVCGLISADGHPLAEDDPLAPVAHELAPTLAGAGFTLYHCDRYGPLCWPGGVCLMPIPTESGTGRSAIAASRTAPTCCPGTWTGSAAPEPDAS